MFYKSYAALTHVISMCRRRRAPTHEKYAVPSTRYNITRRYKQDKILNRRADMIGDIKPTKKRYIGTESEFNSWLRSSDYLNSWITRFRATDIDFVISKASSTPPHHTEYFAILEVKCKVDGTFPKMTYSQRDVLLTITSLVSGSEKFAGSYVIALNGTHPRDGGSVYKLHNKEKVFSWDPGHDYKLALWLRSIVHAEPPEELVEEALDALIPKSYYKELDALEWLSYGDE